MIESNLTKPTSWPDHFKTDGYIFARPIPLDILLQRVRASEFSLIHSVYFLQLLSFIFQEVKSRLKDGYHKCRCTCRLGRCTNCITSGYNAQCKRVMLRRSFLHFTCGSCIPQFLAIQCLTDCGNIASPIIQLITWAVG